MNQLAGVREATWQPNSHPADPLNVHHERQTGYVGRENTGGVGGGSWKEYWILFKCLGACKFSFMLQYLISLYPLNRFLTMTMLYTIFL